MKARYENKAAEWVRRVVLAVLLAVLLFAPGRCIYQNRTVAEMNEYVTAFTYKGESYRLSLIHIYRGRPPRRAHSRYAGPSRPSPPAAGCLRPQGSSSRP